MNCLSIQFYFIFSSSVQYTTDIFEPSDLNCSILSEVTTANASVFAGTIVQVRPSQKPERSGRALPVGDLEVIIICHSLKK